MEMELGYFNSRVRGLRGRLLKRTDYDRLLASDGLGQCFERLRATGYGPYIETAGARLEDPREIIDAATAASLADSLKLPWRVAPPGARPLVKTLYSAWEAYDLKTIIRGIARGVAHEETMRALIPAGEFDLAALNALAGSRDLSGLVRFLSSWASPYAAPVRDGMGEYLRNGSIERIELNLDAFVYGLALSGLDGARGLDRRIIRDAVALRIDTQNMMTLVKISGEGCSKEAAAGFFIEGGGLLTKKKFMALAKGNRRDILNGLSASVKDPDVGYILSESDPDEPGLIEERFDELLRLRLRRLSIVEPLSIALFASYVLMKVRETKNLRLIAAGFSFGVPQNELERMLFYPV